MGLFKTLFGGREETEEEKEAKRQANNFDVLKYDGIQALRIGKTDYAITCLTNALDIQEDREAHVFLVNAYVNKGELESASEELEELCGLYPEDKGFHVTLADMLFQLERYEDMERACAKATALDPTLAAPHYLLARRDHVMGDFEAAEQHVTTAIDLNGELEEAWLLRADIRLKRGQTADALSDVEHLIANGQASEEVLMQKGEILEVSGDIDGAIEFYGHVLEENPFIQEAYSKVACLELQRGNTEAARQMVDEGIEQTGESSLLIGVRAAVKEALGDMEGAEADRRLAADLGSENDDTGQNDYNIEREMQAQSRMFNPF